MKINLNKASVFISLILRHKPEVIGIEIDEKGFASVKELLEGMERHEQFPINFNMLKTIVETDKKGRYSFNDDYTKIRANQGHSLKVNVDMREMRPPKTLYHGTGEKSITSILDKGLEKRTRLHVHLSENSDTAIEVGRRHGKPALILIDAERMHKLGYKFYLSENNVWLTDHVPAEFFKGRSK